MAGEITTAKPKTRYTIGFDGKRKQYVVVATAIYDAAYFDTVVEAQRFVDAKREK